MSTDAGKRLLASLGTYWDRMDLADDIAAIEAEARADAVPDAERLREALVDAFRAMDAACRWAAQETAGVRTIEDADRHIAGYDALIDATARAGVAAGLLFPNALAAPTEERCAACERGDRDTHYQHVTAGKVVDAALPIGEPAMHAHDGLGTHRAEVHHRPKDYRR
jgi:hypothetical protein